MGCCECSTASQKTWLLSLGAIILIISVALGGIWPGLSTRLIDHELMLQNGTENFVNWKKTPFPMYFEVYMFNWTNPHDINAFPKIKPHFEEVGPYVFQEVRERVDIVFDKNGNSVNFNQTRNWHFRPDLSGNLKLSDKITNLNTICATITWNMRYLPAWERRIANELYLEMACDLTKTAKVGQLLFDGYNDPILILLKAIKQRFPSLKINIPFDKFGWFYGRNGSASHDGRMKIRTGRDNIYRVGLMQMWNKKNHTDMFGGECGHVYGTTGELWPPMKENRTHDEITMFIVDICRALTLKYETNVTKFDVSGIKWAGDESMLDGKDCYCLAAKCPDPLLKRGVFNASTCQFGSPAFMSYPHFYLADESYRENVSGMKPNKTRHQMYVSLEPKSGIPLEIRARLQINLMLTPDPTSKIYKHVPNILFPMFWFNQVADITPELAAKAGVMETVKVAGMWTSYVLAAIGATLLLVGIKMAVTSFDENDNLRQQDDESPILHDRLEEQSAPQANEERRNDDTE
ncbi:protein croquemort-like [Culicoides brevitarsis]|uniref:protein croquemort-like n=1 Tax=Culicoides brevitarsis TaxID=469753 RepID=UPI00307BE3A3